MKYLILLMLLLVQTISYTQQTNLTESDRQKLIQGLENGDYSVLIPFMSRKDTTPYIKIRNQYRFTIPLSNDTNLYYKFSQSGKTISYTNQFGFYFVNSTEILWDINDINAMPSDSKDKSEFYDMMKKVFKAKNPQDIIKLYNQYNIHILNDPFPSISISVLELTGQLGINIDKQSLFKSLFPIIYPSEEEQKIYLINYALYYTILFNGSEWTVSIPPRPYKK